MLQHCLPKLKTELKNGSRWDEIVANRSVVQLLLAIRDVTCNKI